MCMFVVGASSDLGQPFCPTQISWVWVGGRIGYSHYNIRTEGALPPSITVIVRFKNLGVGFAMFLLGEFIPKQKYVRSEFLTKVIMALILNECFRNIKGFLITLATH